RGGKQDLVATTVAHVEFGADSREVHAQRVRRDAEALRECGPVEPLSFARQQLHLAEDAELAPGQSDRAKVERRLVESRRAHRGDVVALRAAQRRVRMRADLARQL